MHGIYNHVDILFDNLFPYQVEMLTAVASKQKSLGEMKQDAANYRAKQVVQRQFCLLTNTSWDEACERFPYHTNDERLSQILSLNFKGTPTAFSSYCQAALQSEHTSCSVVDSYLYKGTTAYCV